jgi:LemA protein
MWLEVIIGGIILIIILIILGLFISNYNRFKTLKNGADASLAQIKVALKKRLDMITQLVDTAKGYAEFEKSTMTDVTKMRSKVGQISNAGDLSKIGNQSRKILDNIIAVMENYPDLKSNENVKELMNAIQNIEDEISRHRYTFNNIIQEYNTKTEVVPSNIVANIFHFSKLEYLEFDEAEISKRPETKW